MIGYGTDIETISILGGHGKTGEPESVERVDFNMGDVVSIVGHTGSGKTTLINDIELFANADTPTGRRLLINDAPPPEEFSSQSGAIPLR
jgi:ABC-type lipoprotein export system ATPase subunit